VAAKADRALTKWIQDRDDSGFWFTYRKLVREDVKFLPPAGVISLDLIPAIFASKKNKQIMCEHHRKSKDTAFKRDSAFELVGQIAMKLSADGKEEAFPGHMHCGCPVAEVALEFFLYKTCRAFSSNPANAGRVYQMTDLHMLKPSTRVFWNQSLRDYTGLCTEDFFAVDYGEPTYATRIALQQLHTQIERLKILGVPIEVGLTFKD